MLLLRVPLRARDPNAETAEIHGRESRRVAVPQFDVVHGGGSGILTLEMTFLEPSRGKIDTSRRSHAFPVEMRCGVRWADVYPKSKSRISNLTTVLGVSNLLFPAVCQKAAKDGGANGSVGRICAGAFSNNRHGRRRRGNSWQYRRV